LGPCEIGWHHRSGENIYKGGSVASDAIKGWFLSPGHHKNMFGENHRRQGFTRKEDCWEAFAAALPSVPELRMLV
jgi:hypothetical protein